MSTLEEFILKYGGKYNSEPLKKVHTPGGLFTSQVARAKLNFKDCDLVFWLNESGIDPLRISMNLTMSIKDEFIIYPRSYWGKVFNSFWPNWKHNFSKKIHTQYQFSGPQNIIQLFRDNQSLLELLDGTNICVVKKKTLDEPISLTPAHGFERVEQLEKYSNILVEVQKSIKKLRTTY